MKIKRIISVICCFAIVLCAVGCSKTEPPVIEEQNPIKFTNTVMAENGSTDYKIVIPAEASETVTYAAEELNSFFYQATGARLPVTADSGMSFDSGAKVISLGDTVIKSGAGITVTKQEVNRDGYKLATKGNTVVIAGYNARGTLYGVYGFLTAAFGYECYSNDEIALTKTAKAFLPDLDITEKPSFEGRFLDGPADYNQELQSKMRLKNMHLQARYGGGAVEEWMNMHCESFFSIIPPDTYYASHPEWFAAGKGQLCLTNRELQHEMARVLIERLKTHPEALYVNITEEDTGAMCNCTNSSEGNEGGCEAARHKYGVSGALIRMCNNIIDEIEAWRIAECPERDLKYVTFAYHESIHPPVSGGKPIDDTVIPHDKLYIRFAPIMSCFSHAITDETCEINKTYAVDFNGWKTLTDRLMVWTYDTNYNNYYAYFNSFGSMQDNYIAYYEAGAVNIMVQYTTGSTLASLGDLHIYLNSKLQWNVYEDVDSLINNFMDAYYKDGAPYMKEYFYLMRSHWLSKEKEFKQNGSGLHQFMYETQTTWREPDLWPRAVLEQALKLIEKADAAYDGLEDKALAQKLKTRVLKESVCVRYTVLKNYASYYNIYEQAYKQAVDSFERDVRTLAAYSHREGGSTLNFISDLRK